ncbi:MAG: hypothetical protein QM500_16820 [Methylococcales bacterium]
MAEKISITTQYMKGLAVNERRDWVSPTEIGAEINGGHSSVGTPVCKEMVKQGLLERNSQGHYRLLEKKDV